jgi:CRISPR-associated Cas5-like protein
MYAIEFRIKPCSMYSIRVPFSYQCARTYPLPAASTLKGLCAHALWHFGAQRDSPVGVLRATHDAVKLATSRAAGPVAVSSCTVSQITGSSAEKKTNALLRQFAHTAAIDCLLAVEDSVLADSLAAALRCAPLYLGDSESLAVITTVVRHAEAELRTVKAGEAVQAINTVTPFQAVEPGTVCCDGQDKPVVFYMQDDPVSPEAELKRCLSPLAARGDDYLPLPGFSFAARRDIQVLDVGSLRAVLLPPDERKPATSKKARPRKRSK